MARKALGVRWGVRRATAPERASHPGEYCKLLDQTHGDNSLAMRIRRDRTTPGDQPRGEASLQWQEAARNKIGHGCLEPWLLQQKSGLRADRAPEAAQKCCKTAQPNQRHTTISERWGPLIRRQFPVVLTSAQQRVRECRNRICLGHAMAPSISMRGLSEHRLGRRLALSARLRLWHSRACSAGARVNTGASRSRATLRPTAETRGGRWS